MGLHDPCPFVQQYSFVLKTVHGLLQPPGALNTLGHCPFMSAVHSIRLQFELVALKIQYGTNKKNIHYRLKTFLYNRVSIVTVFFLHQQRVIDSSFFFFEKVIYLFISIERRVKVRSSIGQDLIVFTLGLRFDSQKNNFLQIIGCKLNGGSEVIGFTDFNVINI